MNRKLPLSLTGITMAFPVCGVLAQSNSGQVKRPMNIGYITSDLSIHPTSIGLPTTVFDSQTATWQIRSAGRRGLVC